MPITPAKMRPMQSILVGATGSPARPIPKIAVPAAPIPVHTARCRWELAMRCGPVSVPLGPRFLGMVLLGDPVAPTRILCIGLILAGVIGTRLVS